MCSVFLSISDFSTLFLKKFTGCFVNVAGVLKIDFLNWGNTAFVICDVAMFPLFSHFVLILAYWTMKKSKV